MTKIVYKINGYINGDFTTWLKAQTGFQAILQQDSYSVLARFDHNDVQEDAFRKSLGDNLILGNPDDLIKSDILFTDSVLFISEKTMTKTNLNTTFVNLFTDFGGRPFLADLTGYNRLAVQILWNKNAGGSNHDLRIVNNADVSQVLYEKLNLSNGENVDANAIIPSQFVTFKGRLIIQVKAGNTTDDPIFERIAIYLRR